MKTTVAVFFGGRSVEHEVSIISGIQALTALDSSKYNPLPVYISKDNLFYTGEHMGDIESYKDMKSCMEKAVRVVLVPSDGRVALIRYPSKRLGSNLVGMFDVALPVVHGTNVEDGTLMGLLEMLGVAYTGCDVTSSALGMDKYAMKAVLRQAGLPVLDAMVFTGRQFAMDEDDILNRIEQGLGYPVVVKPVNLGSSVGISLAADRAALKSAMDTALGFSPKALVEPAVQNLREINCSVLGDIDDAQSSVCEEPITSHEILDFSDKYLSNAGEAGGEKSGMSSLRRRLPADIPDEMEKRVRELAVKTFQALGCSGVARVDFLNDRESGELYVNEINTIPGSLSFYLWEASGMNFARLLDRMIELAFKRQRERQALTFTYETNILSGVSFGGAKGAKKA
ncbi:MAG: D-alanine--D-alanine ligase [Clostridiales bacterium]|nr:D-alanine--D-alanine ligase [Clostridiales bacterium]